MADDACSTGTVYADGSSINTSMWSRPWVRDSLTAGVILVIAALVIVSSSVWLKRRRAGLA